MKQHRRFTGIIWTALSVAALTACGGGGGGDDSTFSDNASLSALTISAGPFDPVFSRDQTSYTVDLDVTVSETTVTPTAEDSNIDSLSINGTILASGDTSAPIPLVPGDNVIEVVVTAEDAVAVAAVLDDIARRTGLRPIDLPLLEPFHLDLGFALRWR